MQRILAAVAALTLFATGTAQSQERADPWLYYIETLPELREVDDWMSPQSELEMPIYPFNDALVVQTDVTGGGRARIDHAYELRRAAADGSGGDLLATATSTIACLDGDGRPCALPGWLVSGAHG